MRVWVRHPVSAGASPMIAIATACLILMSTNFKYIFPGSFPLAGGRDASALDYFYTAWMFRGSEVFLKVNG